MIMQWKKQKSGLYQAAWQGTTLLLKRNQKTHKWGVSVSSPVGVESLKHEWPTARAAMDAVDATQQSIVKAAMAARMETPLCPVCRRPEDNGDTHRTQHHSAAGLQVMCVQKEAAHAAEA